jgi:outer membrane protein TolC
MKVLKEKIILGKGILLIAVIILPMFGCSQTCKHFTLDELVRSAYEKYPYANRLELIKEQCNESAKAIDAEWLTHISASAKSSYQSEISSIDIPKDIENKFGINIDKGKKLQYQGGLSVSQLIYDGGVNSIKKRINKLDYDTKSDQVKSQMLQVEDAIDNLFENILLSKEQIKAIQFKRADLELRKKDVSSAIQNGISLKTDIQEIEANIIQLCQQETEFRMSSRQQYITLSSYAQQPIDSTAILELPETTNAIDRNISARPDYDIFSLQLKNAEWELKKLNTEFVPKLSLFANGYYGRPGLNMMKYTNHYSGIVGVSMTWNIDALYNNTHQKKLINIGKEMTMNQQLTYEIDMNRQIDNLNINLLKNRELANSDDNIIQIRSNIKDIASIQLKNGSITLTDYLIKLNDEAQAMVNKSIHHIEYLMDGAKMKTLLNRNN